MRVGVPANPGVDLHPATAGVLRDTVNMLERLGAWRTEISLSSSLRDFGEPFGELLAIEAYRLYGRLAEELPLCTGAFD